MRSTITLTPHTIVIARVLSWEVYRNRGTEVTIVNVDGGNPVIVTGNHDDALREAMDALADIGDDARIISELRGRVEALESVVAEHFKREGA